MYKSERMLKAIGDISDNKIEKTARALGYQKRGGRLSTSPFGWGVF